MHNLCKLNVIFLQSRKHTDGHTVHRLRLVRQLLSHSPTLPLSPLSSSFFSEADSSSSVSAKGRRERDEQCPLLYESAGAECECKELRVVCARAESECSAQSESVRV